MVSKMTWTFLFFCVVLRVASAKTFTIVLDTTFSMRYDVEIIKANIRSVVDAVRLEPHFDEYILVPFSDPDAGVPVTTKSPEDFMNAINAIKTSGGIDCPENSLAGIRKGLEISKPDSYIFVFTDAFANDYDQISAVQGLCGTTRSKVIIFLSGYCKPEEGTVEIYKNITNHCLGTVFQLGVYNFRKAFQLMKEITKVEWNSIQNYPSVTDRYEFEISLDAFTSNMIIVATGNNSLITVQDCVDCEEVMRDTKSFHLLRVKPHVGTYRATLRCDTCLSLALYKRLDLKFKYGFSPRRVQNIKETSLKPIPGINNYITIFLETESVTAESIELQSDGTADSELQLDQVSPGCYYTTAYIYAEKRYRIVVKGYDTSTSQRLTGSTNILQPQKTGFASASMAPQIEIIEPHNTLLEFGTSLTVPCRVTGYPKPDIWWEDDNKKRLNAEDILLEDPAVYISYVTINVTSNSTISCKSKNWDGEASQNLDIYVNKSAILEFVQEPQDQTIEYSSEGKIYCEVNSYPEASIKWYHNDTLLENTDNIKINSEENAIVIQKMGLDDVGEYKCEVSNNMETKSSTGVIEISGLEYPEIATDTSEISIKLGEQARIQCRIVKGNPPPEVTWKYKAEDNDEFGEIPREASFSENEHTKDKNKYKRGVFDLFGTASETKTNDKSSTNGKSLTINTNKAGTYQCKGSNILGENTKEIVLRVQVPPQIRNNGDETVTVRQRHRVELFCEVDADPSANVRWEISQGDVTMPLSDRHHVDDKNTLRFNALWKDSGDYHCIAENDFGRADKRYTVIVHVAPYIEAPQSKVVTAAVGSTVTLHCNVLYGSPQPSTRWEFSPPGSPPTTIRSDSTKVLVLKHITRSQEGAYSCVAENTIGVDKIKILVNVQ